jgi:hypothetical protein
MANEFSFQKADGSFQTEDGRIVAAASATLAATRAKHDDKTVRLGRAAGGVTVTLPAALGSGARFRFVIGTVLSSGSYIVKVANATDYMRGQAFMCNDTDASVSGFETANTGTVATETDTVTLNGGTTGGAVGDLIEVEDIALRVWRLRCSLTGTGSEASPLSAGV